MKKPLDSAAQSNRAVQLNPQNPIYYRSRGLRPDVAERAAQEARQPSQPPQLAAPAPGTPAAPASATPTTSSGTR
jgi:hypothetical protein